MSFTCKVARKQLKCSLKENYCMIMTSIFILVSSQRCTNGTLDPLNVDSYGPNRLVPLLGRHGNSRSEQWIFPSLNFTCYGTLTRWIFRGVPSLDPATPICRVELETWRLDNTSLPDIVYKRLNTTAGNTGKIVQDGPIFTYELASPVQVQPGDIVGVERGTSESCSFTERLDNILSLNISGTDLTFSSYRNSEFSGSLFFLQPRTIAGVNREEDYIPLIEPIFIGKQTVNIVLSKINL